MRTKGRSAPKLSELTDPDLPLELARQLNVSLPLPLGEIAPASGDQLRRLAHGN